MTIISGTVGWEIRTALAGLQCRRKRSKTLPGTSPMHGKCSMASIAKLEKAITWKIEPNQFRNQLLASCPASTPKSSEYRNNTKQCLPILTSTNLTLPMRWTRRMTRETLHQAACMSCMTLAYPAKKRGFPGW